MGLVARAEAAVQLGPRVLVRMVELEVTALRVRQAEMSMGCMEQLRKTPLQTLGLEGEGEEPAEPHIQVAILAMEATAEEAGLDTCTSYGPTDTTPMASGSPVGPNRINTKQPGVSRGWRLLSSVCRSSTVIGVLSDQHSRCASTPVFQLR